MIEAKQILELLTKQGFGPVTGVPCSLFSSLILELERAPEGNYFAATNEGEGMGIAAGFALSGTIPVILMQNSGLGYAINPLTSLHLIYDLPVLIFVSLRGEKGTKDSPEHQIMGPVTVQFLEVMGIEHEFLEESQVNIKKQLSRLYKRMKTTKKPTAIIVKNGQIIGSPNETDKREAITDKRIMARQEAIEAVLTALEGHDETIISTTGFISRELHDLRPLDHQNFYMMGSMGCAPSIALGVALLNKNRKVIVLDGDGALLMQMGTLAAIGHYQPENFIHVLLDNESYQSTGGQKSVAVTTQYHKVAESVGYRSSVLVNEKKKLIKEIERSLTCDGPHFVHIKVLKESQNNAGRVSHTPHQIRDHFMATLKNPNGQKPEANACLPTKQVQGIQPGFAVATDIKDRLRRGERSRIKTAVILAAGSGHRVKSVITELPKGFIRFGKRPIIEESLLKLRDVGIEKIIMVTGFMSHYYEELAKKYPCIQIITNERFAETGNLYSLYCARNSINEDFILLEADLIYEARALDAIQRCPYPNVILMSGVTDAGDETYMETDNDFLVTMSKDQKKLTRIDGELVGICKLSVDFLQEMMKLSTEEFQKTLVHNYETVGLTLTARKIPLYCLKMEDLFWSEIDDKHQFDRAKEVIYPRIQCKEVTT